MNVVDYVDDIKIHGKPEPFNLEKMQEMIGQGNHVEVYDECQVESREALYRKGQKKLNRRQRRAAQRGK